MASSTVEDYLKRIYLCQQDRKACPGGKVPMGKLAGLMGVVPGTATTMIKALADSGLVQYEPRGGVKLTRGGEQLALHVLRRHRLVELFLVRTLGLDWSEVHDEAETLEHAVSEKVLERIDVLLGRPEVDPHGDPIPPANGKMKRKPSAALTNLAEAEVGGTFRVARVMDQNRAFLQFVDRQGLMPGATITVESKEVAADAIGIRVGTKSGDRAITLGSAAAGKILVEPSA